MTHLPNKWGRRILPFSLIALCAQAPMPDRTDSLEAGYALSFRTDACGDADLGDAMRQALMAKFESCPFTEMTRQRFQQMAARQRRVFTGQLAQYVHDHGGPLDHVDGVPSCTAYLHSPAMEQLRSKLFAYRDGKLTLDEVMPVSCKQLGVPSGP
jgi:hypothetical protein